MGLTVGLLDLLKGGMSINLGGREAGVTEKGLDGADVSSVVEHSGGKGVTKHVRRVLLEGGNFAHASANHLIDGRSRHLSDSTVSFDHGEQVLIG